MSTSKDGDDIVFVEEVLSTGRKKKFRRRSSPLLLPVDEPGPSGSAVSIETHNAYNASNCECLRTESYEHLLELERLISCVKSPYENSESNTATLAKTVEAETCEVACVVDDEFKEVPEKRKRKAAKKKVLSEVQLRKEAEKKRKAIEREISASMKSKCEQHMFCHISRRIFDEFPESELHVRMLFAERNIDEQIVCDEQRPNMQVLWYRKCIQGVEIEGKVEKQEYQALQHSFAVVLSSSTFKELVTSNTLEDFVTTQKLSYEVPNSTMILIIYGKDAHRVISMSIKLFDYYQTQLHYVHNAQEFATYLAQVTRALAKMENRLAHRDRLIVNVDKGIKEAGTDDLVCDWWNKMLAVICRMQDGQRRAILSTYPNPFVASKRFTKMGYSLAVREIAEIPTETGRRIGPVMAHRLFMILTDLSGMEIVG